MNRIEHLLTILMEEACELAVNTSKANRFGILEQRDLPTSNLERMEAEYNDLFAVVEMIADEGHAMRLSADKIKAKKEKVEKYLIYSAERGTLSQ